MGRWFMATILYPHLGLRGQASQEERMANGISIMQASQTTWRSPGWWWRTFLAWTLYSLLAPFSYVLLVGWYRRYYQLLQRGENRMPEFSLAGTWDDLKLGIRPSLNLAVAYGLLLVIYIGMMFFLFLMMPASAAISIIGVELGADSVSELGKQISTVMASAGAVGVLIGFGGLVITEMVMVVLLILPAADVTCRCFNGERWPIFSPWSSLRLTVKNLLSLFWIALGWELVAILALTAGLLACGIGALPAMLFCLNLMLVLMVQWDALVRPDEANVEAGASESVV